MKILVTGISGYLGKVLLPYLINDDKIEKIIGLDIKKPNYENEKLSFINVDIRNPEIIKYFQDIDAVVHLAFIVAEIKDKKTIYDINLNGAKNVLEAVKKSHVKKLIVASSIAAYGAHEQPELITEDTPLRGNENSYYSHTKFLMEKMLDDLEKENKNIMVTRLRAAVFCGANTNNFFLEILKTKILFYSKSNPELILVHEDDVARAFYLAIKRDVFGAFNITSGNLNVKDMANILNIPAMAVPYFVMKIFSDILFKIGVSPVSSHWVVLGRYPFMVSNEKAKRILDWSPKHTSIEAFQEMVHKWKSK